MNSHQGSLQVEKLVTMQADAYFEVVGKWLPAKSFVRSRSGEEICVDTVEISKIGIDFQNPITLSEDDGADVDTADCSA